jgi:outer membrane receptor for ferrienterochelin and colicins
MLKTVRDRHSYYGVEQSLIGYGNSRDNTFNLGVQYKAVVGNSSLVSGIENTSGFLLDKKLGYPDPDNAAISGDSITGSTGTRPIFMDP